MLNRKRRHSDDGVATAGLVRALGEGAYAGETEEEDDDEEESSARELVAAGTRFSAQALREKRGRGRVNLRSNRTSPTGHDAFEIQQQQQQQQEDAHRARARENIAAALKSGLMDSRSAYDPLQQQQKVRHKLFPIRKKTIRRNIMRHRPQTAADDSALLLARSVPEDESIMGGSPHGVLGGSGGGGFSAARSVDSRDYPHGHLSLAGTVMGIKGSSSAASSSAGKRQKKITAMSKIKRKMMARTQRSVRGQHSRRRSSKLGGSGDTAGEIFGDTISDEGTQVDSDEEASPNRLLRSLRPRRSSGLRTLGGHEDDNDGEDRHRPGHDYDGDELSETAFEDGGMARHGLPHAQALRAGRGRGLRAGASPPLGEMYAMEDESASEYSKALPESDFEGLDQISAASNGFTQSTLASRGSGDPARRRRSSVGPLQRSVEAVMGGAPSGPSGAGASLYSTDRLSEDAASDDGLSASARGGLHEAAAHEHPVDPRRAQRRVGGVAANSERAKMVNDIRAKLIQWKVPQAEWHLPSLSSPNGGGGGRMAGPQGSDGTLYEDDRPADARVNEQRIRQLQEENEVLRALVSKRKMELERVHASTRTKVNELKEMVRNFERKLAFYDRNVNEKHAQINEHLTRFKSEMTSDIRERVRKQLESREEDYYNLIERVQDRMNLISDIGRDGNGFINSLMHRSFALVLSGAGTIAHFVSMIVGIILAPFFFVFSLFKQAPRPREDPDVHGPRDPARVRRELRARSSSQSSGISKMSTRGMS